MINKVILIGNVGVDPEVRHLDQNTSVCNISLATSETYRTKDGQTVTNTEWHNIVLWRWLADVAEKYVKKGSQLYIEGKLRTRSWEDKEGNKRYTTEVVADQMKLLGKREDNQGSSYSDNSQSQYSQNNNQEQNSSDNTSSEYENPASNNNDEPDDDLPF